jgi:hypothetical protein
MRYPVAEHGTRRLVLRRFPYNVFFRAGALAAAKGIAAGLSPLAGHARRLAALQRYHAGIQ